MRQLSLVTSINYPFLQYTSLLVLLTSYVSHLFTNALFSEQMAYVAGKKDQERGVLEK